MSDDKITVYLTKSKRPDKKYTIKIGPKTIHFGAKGYDDFTLSGDGDKRDRYLARHAKREDWTASGILTPGFWSRHLLWGRWPLLKFNIIDIEKDYGLIIDYDADSIK